MKNVEWVDIAHSIFGSSSSSSGEKAFYYFDKAGKVGDPDGYYNIGYCYLHGQGVMRNHQKALIYMEKSANMGKLAAMQNTAWLYE